MILAEEAVRDPHRDIGDHIHKMKHRIAVRTHDDEILILHPLHAPANPILDHHGWHLDFRDRLLAVLVEHLITLAEQLEPNRTVLLVGAARREQFANILLVDRAALALAIWAEVAATARADLRALVPVEPEPRE